MYQKEQKEYFLKHAFVGTFGLYLQLVITVSFQLLQEAVMAAIKMMKFDFATGQVILL